MLGYLGNDRGTQRVIDALKAQIAQPPETSEAHVELGSGHELAAHTQFTIETGVQVFFCDPHSPRQRRSNENTNGLLRQYLPNGTDLALHDQAELDRIAALLNGRPRQTLGWMNPAEKMAHLLAKAPHPPANEQAPRNTPWSRLRLTQQAIVRQPHPMPSSSSWPKIVRCRPASAAIATSHSRVITPHSTVRTRRARQRDPYVALNPRSPPASCRVRRYDPMNRCPDGDRGACRHSPPPRGRVPRYDPC
jgi:hypothetical protein